MGFAYLALAIVFEVAGTTSMKLSEGFTKPLWVIPLVLGYLASLGLLTLSLRTLSIGTAYAVWSGLGTALVVLVGLVLFRETLTWGQWLSVALIIAGVAGLNLLGNAHT